MPKSIEHARASIQLLFWFSSRRLRWALLRGVLTTTGAAVGAVGPLLAQEYNEEVALIGVVAVLIGLLGPSRLTASEYIRRLGYESPIASDAPQVSSQVLDRDTIRRVLTETGLSSPKPGRMTLDIACVLSSCQDLYPRVAFPTDSGVLEDITHLNTIGFANSPYGSATDPERLKQKQARNLGIVERHPYTFAALRDSSNSDLYVGFSSVVPLTPSGAHDYLHPPGVSDNDLPGDLVAGVGDDTDTVLLFGLSTIKLRRGHRGLYRDPMQAVTARRPDVMAVRDIARVAVVQLAIVIALAAHRHRIRVVGQSRVRSIQKMFTSIGMECVSRYTTGDNEPLYLADLAVTDDSAAQADFLRLWVPKTGR